MITKHLINEIKSLSKGISAKTLEEKYFIALELLDEADLISLRDSFVEEQLVSKSHPDLSHLY
jgi:hypothetical protein